MTDIIANAQRLLDGVVYQYGGEPILVADAKDVSPTVWGDEPPYDYEIHSAAKGELMAAALEMAQALAEETYFYGVQVLMGGRWIMMLTSNYGTSLMHRGKWFESKDEAQACAATWSHDTPTRIVRQRRSPAEVCRTALKPAAAGTTESDK